MLLQAQNILRADILADLLHQRIVIQTHVLRAFRLILRHIDPAFQIIKTIFHQKLQFLIAVRDL